METVDGFLYASDDTTVTITNSEPAPFVDLTWRFEPMIYGGERTNLTVFVDFLTEETGLITLDIANYSVEAAGANVQCNSPETNIECSFADGIVSITPL